MNISTVNELIQSLESAGELSIKETKVMALAKAYQQLAAENVRLAAENKMAVDAVTVFSNVTHDVTEIICDELGHDRVAEIVAAYNDLGNMPATDSIVAGIKADEEKEVLNDLLRHLDKIDIENLSSPWELSSEVVAFVNSRLLREGAK